MVFFLDPWKDHVDQDNPDNNDNHDDQDNHDDNDNYDYHLHPNLYLGYEQGDDH